MTDAQVMYGGGLFAATLAGGMIRHVASVLPLFQRSQSSNGNGHKKNDADRLEIRAQEETRAMVSSISQAVKEGHREYVTELHTVRLGLEAAAGALTRMVERLDDHAKESTPAIKAAIETREAVGRIESQLVRPRRRKP